MNAIADYIAELSPQLRRSRRSRILTEVRAHLLEAAATDSLRGVDPDRAARRAVERFGAPAQVAVQFNAVRRLPGGLLGRIAAVILASASMATLGTATVWATGPGTSHPRPHTQRHAQARRTGGEHR